MSFCESHRSSKCAQLSLFTHTPLPRPSLPVSPFRLQNPHTVTRSLKDRLLLSPPTHQPTCLLTYTHPFHPLTFWLLAFGSCSVSACLLGPFFSIIRPSLFPLSTLLFSQDFLSSPSKSLYISFPLALAHTSERASKGEKPLAGPLSCVFLPPSYLMTFLLHFLYLFIRVVFS